MDDLVAFLRARLDEDEAAAQEATPGPWDVGGVALEFGSADVVSVDGAVTSAYEEPCCSIEDAGHIARHDPARVLRAVAGKSQVVGECAARLRTYGSDAMAELILVYLAQEYADHPEFRSDWKV